MRRWPLLLFLLLLAGVESLDAQCRTSRDRRRHECRARRTTVVSPVQFGVRGGYDFTDEEGSAGAQLRLPVAPQLLVVPSGDVFFADAGTEWQLNTDLVLRPSTLAGVYGGIGVAFVNREFEPGDDSETEVGFNLLLGLEGGRIAGSTLRPFVEGRWTRVEDHSPFRLVAGFNVPVSGGPF
jgi:hypothetical protein